MNINITAEDYFNELKLMQKQYGQEEDLYPWVYMILQMAECRKRKKAEEEGKEYIPVSIRDVHKAEVVSFNGCKKIKKTDAEAKKYWEIRWELTKRVGPPDFAVIDDNGEIVGCVEIKILKEELFTQEPKELKIGLPQKQNYILKKDGDYVKIESNSKEYLESIAVEFLCNYGKTFTIDSKKSVWEYDPKPNAGTESDQLAGHLDKFKNVLFTNGLKFYFLKLDNENNVTIKDDKPLADFTKIFNKYKSDGNITKDAQTAWDNLIENLADIDWHEKANNNNNRQQ